MDSRHDRSRSLGAVVAGTARWASQHYRSRISHGFQKLPTLTYTYVTGAVYVHVTPAKCACVRDESLRRLPAAVVELANRGEKRPYRERDDILRESEGALRLSGLVRVDSSN